MSQVSTIDRKRALFPSNWVIGTAAAVLARNDPGVLLPGDPIPDDQREGEAVPSPPAAANSHSRAAEIAALHAENERLRQRIMATRQRLRPLAERVAAASHPGRPTAVVAESWIESSAAPRPRGHQRARAGVGRLAIAALLLAILGVAGGWFALQGSDERAMTLQQVRTFSGDWRAGVAGLGAKLASGSDALFARIDSMTNRVAGLWMHASARRAGQADDTAGRASDVQAATDDTDQADPPSAND